MILWLRDRVDSLEKTVICADADRIDALKRKIQELQAEIETLKLRLFVQSRREGTR